MPVGAVLVRDGKIIARGKNKGDAPRSLGHAEISAISDGAKEIGSWRLNDCTLYVTLEPCPMCAGAIINARVGGWFTEPPTTRREASEVS